MRYQLPEPSSVEIIVTLHLNLFPFLVRLYIHKSVENDQVK
jgi:hypothetical protein